MLIRLLASCGHEVELISQLRSWEGRGDPIQQERLRIEAEAETSRLLDAYRRDVPPDLIFVYHLYHKAPDWIGVELSRQLDIPYIVAEASTAPSQANGKWAAGHAQALACIAQAAGIITLNPRDNPCLEAVCNDPDKILNLLPFADPAPVTAHRDELRRQFAGRHGLNLNDPWIMVVAMMRKGDKLASFAALSRALVPLQELAWNCVVIGDGPAAPKVKSLFNGLGDRCRFTGELGAEEVARWLQAGDLFVWPAINEAFGMGLLEAAAAGLPAVVFDYGGVGTIVEDGETGFVCRSDDLEQFVSAISKLLTDPAMREIMSGCARKKFLMSHTLDAAAGQVDDFFRRKCRLKRND